MRPGGPTAWIQIGDLPPKSNWSSMRRLVTQAGGELTLGALFSCFQALGGHILGGKVGGGAFFFNFSTL